LTKEKEKENVKENKKIKLFLFFSFFFVSHRNKKTPQNPKKQKTKNAPHVLEL
jgi:hypothetical protein